MQNDPKNNANGWRKFVLFKENCKKKNVKEKTSRSEL